MMERMVISALAIGIFGDGAQASADDLRKNFANPPNSVRPSCYWWWLNNLLDKPGITRDLEEAKSKGLGGVMFVASNPHCGKAGPIPEGPRYLSSEWRELYKFALQEADRLGLEAGVNFCGGWDMGGPWITPENAGRWYLQTEFTVTGPQKFSAVLPLPEPKTGYDSPPLLGVKELEVDWFSKAAVDQHWKNLGRILLADAGPLADKTMKYFHTDSFEDGYPNWTAKILQEFKSRRGYDMTQYLPVLMGRLVGSAEISDRFLYDYRKTVADCMADNNYGYLAELLHGCGMELCAEAAGPSWSATVCMDGSKNLGRCDWPMGEFWMDLFNENNQSRFGKPTASASHIYGRRTASAEAFTSWGHWIESPASMKSIGDMAFCEGINRFVFSFFAATRPQDGLPGYEFGAGTHFNPNVTWWQMGAGPWLSYVGRCQALLQSGLFVADVV